MAINLKAKETLIQVGEQKGNYRYVLGTDLYSKLTESKVIQEAALRSGVSRGVMQACWDAAGNVIMAWATEGHSVAIPGLGTMRFGVRAKSVSNVAEVASSLITSRRVIFTPNVEIKNELQRTAIQITCYDRNGKLVKKVTSGDKGDVEDPDKEPNGSEGENSGSKPNGENKGDTGSEDNELQPCPLIRRGSSKQSLQSLTILSWVGDFLRPADFIHRSFWSHEEKL